MTVQTMTCPWPVPRPRLDGTVRRATTQTPAIQYNTIKYKCSKYNQQIQIQNSSNADRVQVRYSPVRFSDDGRLQMSVTVTTGQFSRSQFRQTVQLDPDPDPDPDPS